jgi:hypothetical protein
VFKTLVIASVSLSLVAAILLVRRMPTFQPHPIAAFAAPAVRSVVHDQPRVLKIVNRAGSRSDVFLFVHGAWTNLTRFSTPQTIFAAEASHDGKWAFVWHHERGPRVLSIYNLQSMQRSSSFQPGFGGQLGWTPGNVIFHRWGCGTHCACYCIYDLHGQMLESNNASGIEVSPDFAYFATFPSFEAAAGPLLIRDLRTLATIYTSDAGADVHVVNDIDWGGNGVATVQYTDSIERDRTLRVQLAGN